MAELRWPGTLARIIKKYIFGSVSNEVINPLHTPQRYLEVARKCMENAKRMASRSASTAVLFNHGQCALLTHKVEVAVIETEAYFPLLSPEFMASFVLITTLLCRCAEEVEAFVQSCRQDNWVQAALILWNSSGHVSSISSDLDFCICLLKDFFVTTSSQGLPAAEVLDKYSESVNTIVRRDQWALLRRLEAMNESKNSSDEERAVVKYLSVRLTRHLTGVDEAIVWKINHSSLRELDMLGSGSFGMVFRSTWLGVEVAVKEIFGDKLFRNEFDISAGFAHPHIVPFLGYVMDESRCSIVMELMDGNLKFLMEERLRQNPGSRFPFTTAEAVDMMLQTAEGMRYIHANNVVHMGLKSSNILMKRRKGIDGKYIYCVKVADFALSERKMQSSSYEPLTLNKGTTRWMAPELISQGAHYPHDAEARTELSYPFKVDVYSFAMVCYEILTGDYPFSSHIRIRGKFRSMLLAGTRPELPDECPSDLKTLIDSCWQSNAKDRPSFIDICERLRCIKYQLIGDVETIHDNLEEEIVQKNLPIEEKENAFILVGEDNLHVAPLRIELLQEKTSDGEAIEEEPVAMRMSSEISKLSQKQVVGYQFMRTLQDVYKPKSIEEFQRFVGK